MAAEITIEMNVERKNLIALKVSERITVDVPTVLVLVEGELIVEHQDCGSCRRKTTGLTQLGTQITLAKDVTYRLRNNTMKRAACLVICPEINEPE